MSCGLIDHGCCNAVETSSRKMSSWKPYVSIGLKLASLGFVIAAGSFWAGAGVDSRPKYRDEQSLVAGTVWSQILIPIGLMISKAVDEDLDIFIQGYFLVSGILLLFATAVILIVGECLSITKQRRAFLETGLSNEIAPVVLYDKIYFCIGCLTLAAGLLTLADFIVLLI